MFCVVFLRLLVSTLKPEVVSAYPSTSFDNPVPTSDIGRGNVTRNSNFVLSFSAPPFLSLSCDSWHLHSCFLNLLPVSRMSSSGMWRCVDFALTDVSEERIASIFRVEKSASGEPAWAGGCRVSHQSEITSYIRTGREGVGHMWNQQSWEGWGLWWRSTSR
jgi:hypothetical protein